MEPGRLIFSSPSPGGGCRGQMMFLDCGGGGMFGGSSVIWFAFVSFSCYDCADLELWCGSDEGGGPVAGVEEGRGGVKRPLFTSADELHLDEDYFDEQLPEKKRRLTPEQVHMLERSFEDENKLEPERKAELARKLGLQPRQVAVWFQNRRARWKTKQLERDFDGLKASFDALRAEHDALLHHNHLLRSQVLALTEKLGAKEEAMGGGGGGATATADTLEVQADVGVSVGDGELPPEVAAVDTQSMKVEERLSPGSGGSVVVDAGGAQLVMDSSGESYFPGDDYGGCGGVVAVDNGEDDGAGSDEGCSYYCDTGVIFGAHGGGGHDDVEEDGQLGWWMWN